MIIEGTIIEDTLKGLLQKDLKMYIKNKCVKSGKLLLFKQNNYHLELTIQRKDNEIKRFEIPIPYNIEEWQEDNLIYFDYRLHTLSRNNAELYTLLKTIRKTGNNKYYDNILEIEVVPDIESK